MVLGMTITGLTPGDPQFGEGLPGCGCGCWLGGGPLVQSFPLQSAGPSLVEGCGVKAPKPYRLFCTHTPPPNGRTQVRDKGRQHGWGAARPGRWRRDGGGAGPFLLTTQTLGPGALRSLSLCSWESGWSFQTEAPRAAVSCSPCHWPCRLWAWGKRGPDGPDCEPGLLLRAALLSPVLSLALAARSFLGWFSKSPWPLLVQSQPRSSGAALASGSPGGAGGR